MDDVTQKLLKYKQDAKSHIACSLKTPGQKKRKTKITRGLQI